MMTEPLPPISKAFTILMQQERQYDNPLPLNLDSETKILSVDSRSETSNKSTNSQNLGTYKPRGGSSFRGRGGRSGGRNLGMELCTHYERTNRTIDTCFLKHGYPYRYQNNRAHRMANNAIVFPLDPDTESTATHSQTHKDRSFTEAQFQGILQLLHNSQPDSSHAINSVIDAALHNEDNTSPQWLLNTGATGHISCNIEQFKQDD